MPRPTFAANPVKFKTYELAERLGRTVRELCQTMTVPDLVEWIAYDRYHAALLDQAREQAELDAHHGK